MAYQASSDSVRGKAAVVNLLAQWYKKEKQFDLYLSMAKEFRSDFPNDNLSFNFILDALYVGGDIEKVEQELRRFIAQNLTDTIYRYKLVSLLAKQEQRYNDFISELQKIEKITPASSRPLTVKVKYFLDKKDYQKALVLVNQAKARFPKSVVGDKLAGEMYKSMGLIDESILAYESAFKKQPERHFLVALIDVLNKGGRYKRAKELLLLELEKSPGDFSLQLKLGQIYIQMKQHSLAISLYEKLLKLQPKNTLVLNDLAWLYMLTDNVKALELSERAYLIAPKSWVVVDTYGVILLKYGKNKQGLVVLLQALALNESNLMVHFHLAQAYVSNHQKQKAVNQLKAVIDRQWSSKLVHKEAKKLLMQLQSDR